MAMWRDMEIIFPAFTSAVEELRALKAHPPKKGAASRVANIFTGGGGFPAHYMKKAQSVSTTGGT